MRSNFTSPQTDSQSDRLAWLYKRRGGGLTKFKGVTCGVAPVQTSLGAVVMLSAVTAFGGFFGSAQDASAGSCAAAATSVCSGAAGADSTQTFNYATPVDITTASGFGITTAAGNTFSVNSDGGFSFTDGNASAITGDGYGFEVVNAGSGDLVVTSNGSITGTNFDALQVQNNVGTGSIVLEVNELNSGRRGIESRNYGTGGIAITATGTIISEWDGIVAETEAASTGDITVSVVDIDAAGNGGNGTGIYVVNRGTGEISIAASGTVSSENGVGINAVSGAQNTGLTIDANVIESGSHGVNMTGNSGTGDRSITANVIDAGNNGINVDTGTDTSDFNVDVNEIVSGNNGIFGYITGNGSTNITAGSINAASNGIWVDVDATPGAGVTTLEIGDIVAGNEGINIETYGNTSGLDINANNVTADSHSIRFNHFGTGDTIVRANDITSNSGNGIWFYTAGEGDAVVSANNIDSVGNGIQIDTSWTSNEFSIDVNNITSGADGINAIHSGTGTIDISVDGSILADDDAIEFYADSFDAAQINVDVNNATGGDYGIYVISSAGANAPNDPTAINDDVNVTTSGLIQGGSGWGIWTETNAGVLTNITVEGSSTVQATSGNAIANDEGDAIVVLEDGAVVNGYIGLAGGTNTINVYGGLAGETWITGYQGQDTYNLIDAAADEMNASDLVAYEVVNLDNANLTFTEGTGYSGGSGDAFTMDPNFAVAAPDAATNGMFLRNGSTLTVNPASFELQGHISLGAGTAFSTIGDGTTNASILGQVNNGGTISLVGGGAGDVLTIGASASGYDSYIGNGGVIEIETVLGDDSSATDLVRIQGDVSGTTSVIVTNLGGTGAVTNNGILVVEVTDASTAAMGDEFVLGGDRVRAGSYLYSLHHAATSSSDGWYLHSEAIAPDGPAAVGPAIMDTFARLPTLEQRVGQRYWSGTVEQSDNGLISGAWIRVYGSQSDLYGGAGSDISHIDVSYAGTQAGIDAVVDGGWVLGVTAQFGQLNTLSYGSLGPSSAEVETYGLGVTATWYGDNGLYVDGQLQANRVSMSVENDLGETVFDDVKAGLFSASVEVGKSYDLNNGSVIIPQAQFTYSHMTAYDTVTEDGAVVRSNHQDMSLLRLGVAYEFNELIDDGKFYTIANLYHNFDATSSVSSDDTVSTFVGQENWGEVGMGLSLATGKNSIVYGEASYARAFKGDGERLSGTIGLRATW